MAGTRSIRARLFRLRIELQGVTPLVWRRLWIGGDAALIKLHHVIQAAMGWTDAHLHEFRIGDAVYATPHPEDELDRKIVDERSVRLSSVLQGVENFTYTYDFGDGWDHAITVEGTEKMTELSPRYGFVEAGERACPPEDSGGAGAYQYFLDQLAKAPDSEEVREFLEWSGPDFDPERFDRHAANAALLRMAWNQWGEK